MRRRVVQAVATLPLMLHGLVGCVTTPDAVATDASVLADARSRSAPYCAKYAEGCEVTTRRTEDGWTASVVPVLRATNGQRAYGIDSDDFYIYDSRGRFRSALRGY